MLVQMGSPSFRRKAVDYVPFQNVKKFAQVVNDMDSIATKIYQAKKQSVNEELAHGDHDGQQGSAKDLVSHMRK
jgi:hypothetical protein